MDSLKLRIHHFFDIIRDFGKKEEFKPHPYGHSYHKIAKAIWEDPGIRIRIVTECDDICEGCIHFRDNTCDDMIDHRKDFIHKEEFNDYLDHRIMKVCQISEDKVFTPIGLCAKSKSYLENIFWIYEGNDPEHTRSRKERVVQGLKIYSQKHDFDIK